jgi:hypothetical protein
VGAPPGPSFSWLIALARLLLKMWSSLRVMIWRRDWRVSPQPGKSIALQRRFLTEVLLQYEVAVKAIVLAEVDVDVGGAES